MPFFPHQISEPVSNSPLSVDNFPPLPTSRPTEQHSFRHRVTKSLDRVQKRIDRNLQADCRPSHFRSKSETNPQGRPALELPSQPNQLVPRDTTSKPESQAIQTAREFYTKFIPLVSLLHALQAEYQEVELPKAADSDYKKSLRQFVDGFAFLCDLNKVGGDTCTAVALERCSATKIFLHLSSNTTIHTNGIKLCAQDILKQLSYVGSWPDQVVEQYLLSLSLRYMASRIDGYAELALRALDRLPVAQKKKLPVQVQTLYGSLGILRAQGRGLACYRLAPQHIHSRRQEVVKESYRLREAGVWDELKRSHGTDSHGRVLHHNLAMIGKHLRIIKQVVQAARDIPILRRIQANVISHEQPAGNPGPVHIGNMINDPVVIIKHAFANLSRTDPSFIHQNELVDFPCLQLSAAKMEAFLDGNKIRAKRLAESRDRSQPIHAEVLLAGAMKHRNFLGERYLGCSKPACYTCKNILSWHPGGYVSPATHKVCFPYRLTRDNTSSASNREIWNRILDQAERDLLLCLKKHEGCMTSIKLLRPGGNILSFDESTC